EHQQQQHPRCGGPHDLAETHIGNPGGHKQIQADRRRHHADFQVDNHNDTEMHRVNAQLRGDGQHQRRHDQDDAGRLHEHAGHKQQYVDHDQKLPRRHVPGNDLLGNGLRDTFSGQHVREQERVGDDEHQHDRDFGSVDQDFRHLPEADVTVNEYRHEERINRGYGGRLGGGENTTINTAENDDDQHQPPEGVTPGYQHFFQRCPRLTWKVLDPSHHVNGHHQNQPEQDPRQHAGHEQIADRGLGRGTVHHQHDR